jgi:tRNA threonylcarbamoyladenosine biosynthesis protein TsaE
MVVTLHGDLGAGKTTVVRGALRALGWTGPVKSPTYTLVEHYPFSRLYFYHFDFYRFADPSEWETAGLAECFRDDAVCLVEWPERVAGLLPLADVDIALAHSGPGGSGRDLVLSANTEAGERCLDAIILTMTPPPTAG